MAKAAEESATQCDLPKTIDDLHWNWAEDGILKRQQLQKEVVFNRNGWVLMAYLYRDVNLNQGEYKAPRVALVRYRRQNGVLRRKGQAFNMNATQCFVAHRVIGGWLESHVKEGEKDFEGGGVEMERIS